MTAPNEKVEQLDPERHGGRLSLVQREARVARGARAHLGRVDAPLETGGAEKVRAGTVHWVHQDLAADRADQVLGNLVLEQLQIQAHADPVSRDVRES